MRSKFRMLTIMVTTIVMIFVFAGCGNSAKSVKGETFDGGNPFTVQMFSVIMRKGMILIR